MAEGEGEGEADEREEGLAVEGDSSSALEGAGFLEEAGLSDRECACDFTGKAREGGGGRDLCLAPPPGLSAAGAEGRRRPETAAISEERLSR